MQEFGRRNRQVGADAFGLSDPSAVHWNDGTPQLYEHAIRDGEGILAEGGGLSVSTGRHTGRSAQDKFIVREPTSEDQIWWEGNKAMEPDAFERLLADFREHARGRRLYAQDLFGGADPDFRLPTRIFTEQAWHALFIRNLLIRPASDDLDGFQPQLTILNFPSFRANPDRHGIRAETVIAMHLTRGIVLIGGTSYAGEMKKSVFTFLNFLLPERGVMPMHCSANAGESGDVAVFFGLSGTGKTTLSADPDRILIGDDEHGWSDRGIFNFEGGCYAKTSQLSAEAEPQIYATTKRFGTVLENVVLDPATRAPDFDDESLTENARCAYPIDFIDNASETGQAGHPTDIVMLTADAFGVLPPIARLTPAQAMVHFLSGYTAKVAGTEKGVTEPEATFSTCFGAPFMPRRPAVYGEMLRDKIARRRVKCWLVNTGWTGGPFGVGERMPIKATRRLLAAALGGELDDATTYTDPYFGFAVPESVNGVDRALLRPRATWTDPAAYDRQAAKLVALFGRNFAQYADEVDEEVRRAAPSLPEAE